MHYPLQTIHDLVFNRLQPSQLLLLNPSGLSLLWQKAHYGVADLTGLFLQSVCSLPTKKEKKTMVQSFHAATVVLCNCLHGYANIVEGFSLKEGSKQELAAGYRELRDQLFSSLTVLDQFPELVNKNQVLPAHAIEAERVWVQQAAKQTSENWKKKIDPELLCIVLQPLQDFAGEHTESTPSGGLLDYLKKLVLHTKRLSQVCPAEAGTAMVHLLIRLNCNSNAFIQYAGRCLRPHPLDEGTPAYLLQYRRILLQLKQIQPIPAVALHRALPSCQSEIIRFLQDEILLLENHLQNPPVNAAATALQASATQPMLKSCLTMSQLAVFLRWCYQTGILRAETTEDLFRVVAKTVVTAGKGRFKPSSLQTEYYELDPTAVSGAKNYVIQLLNEARKYPQ